MLTWPALCCVAGQWRCSMPPMKVASAVHLSLLHAAGHLLLLYEASVLSRSHYLDDCSLNADLASFALCCRSLALQHVAHKIAVDLSLLHDAGRRGVLIFGVEVHLCCVALQANGIAACYPQCVSVFVLSNWMLFRDRSSYFCVPGCWYCSVECSSVSLPCNSVVDVLGQNFTCVVMQAVGTAACHPLDYSPVFRSV